MELGEAAAHQLPLDVEDHLGVAADVDDGLLGLQVELLAQAPDDVLDPAGPAVQPALRGSVGREIVGT